MSFSTFQIYLRAFFPRVPLWHWVVMGVVALALTVGLIGRKRFSVYGSIALGVAFFMGLYLLDALALVRIDSRWVEHPGIDLGAELRRIISGNEENLMLMLFNTAVFAPFGLALGVFLKSTGMGFWRCLGRVTMVAFGLSLCIECIQWALHVGIFEVTDLVLNAVGAGIGMGIALGMLRLFINREHPINQVE